MLRNRIIYLIVLTAGLFFFALYNGALGWQMLMLIVLLPVLSLIMTLVSLRGVSIGMDAPERVTRGTAAEIAVSVSGGGLLPVPAVSVLVETGGREDRVKAGWLDEGQAISVETEHCRALGCVMTGVRIYDYLGLFSLRRRVRGRQTITVMPVFGEAGQSLTSVIAESTVPPSQGGYSEIYELRDYRPGDSLRMIHWKLSQKTDRLLIREPQTASGAVAALTVDILPPSDEFDSVMDRLASTSAWMLARGITHIIAWQEGQTTVMAKIAAAEELHEALAAILAVPYDPDAPRMSEVGMTLPAWHIETEGGAVNG